MLVSVIIPTYNCETYLSEAIDSYLNQTHKDLEIIVVDDCSTDSTYRLLEYYKAKDKRFKYFRNEKNMGISYTRNKGIKESTGVYIAVADADDVASPSRIKKSIKNLEGVDCVYSSYLQANENGKVFGLVEAPSVKSLNMKEILKTQMIPHVTMMGKRELFRYKDEYRTNDDLDLVARLFSEGVKFKKIREPLMIVRYHNKSTSVTKDREVKKVTELIKGEYDTK